MDLINWLKEKKMSSYLTIAVREENGKVHSHQRLNTYDWFVNNARFLEKDSSHILRYVGKTQLDYEGGSRFHLAPEGIDGKIIAFDQQKNKIMAFTNETPSIGFISFANLAFEIPHNKKDIPCWANEARLSEEAGEVSGRFNKLLEKRRIIGVGKKDQESTYIPQWQIIGESLEDLGRAVREAMQLSDGYKYAFLLDMSPFEVKRYSTQQALEMIQDLESADFNLTKKDRAIWNNVIKQAEERK